MLGKLLKHDFRATARIFALMYAAILLLAAINAILLPFGDQSFLRMDNEVGQIIYSIVTSLLMFLYVLAVCAVFVLTFVIIVVRFYRMFGNEGYLWFTLPATANQHLISKLIVAFVWTIASGLVALISIGLVTVSTGWLTELYRIPEVWNELVSYGFNPGFWLSLSIVLLLASWLQSITMFYAAIALGPNIVKSRLGGSVLAYLIMYVAVSVLSTILMIALVIPLNNHMTYLYNAYDASNFASAAMSVDQIALIIIGSYSALALVVAAASYVLSHYFMSKKLNLP